jgi:hypothetical protein
MLSFIQNNFLEDSHGSLTKELLKRGNSLTTWTTPYGLLINADSSKEFTLDHYSTCHFLDYEMPGEQFDLITTYTGMCYFKMDDYFEKFLACYRQAAFITSWIRTTTMFTVSR